MTKAIPDGTTALGGDGILRVGGTTGDDVIAIGATTVSGQPYVQVKLAGKVIGKFPAALVKEIHAWGREGNDKIQVSGLAIDAVLSGGSGNDSLNGGNGVNRLLAASGTTP